MSKTISTFIAGVAALTLSAGAYAQANNTLATPSVVSPAAANANANATSGYGAPGAANSDSGMSTSPNSANNGAAPIPGGPNNNTLATPTTASPAAK
ncbi:hypothetical protein [Paraburkholderia sp. J7]|uniref:hypothetical protein n=1 Tax=Paraburkholderia sp. J7 TaxID=2805438 RepID=UPI002AB6E394|nr:hypothetical protein [Paraburkholderia sp. J7]